MNRMLCEPYSADEVVKSISHMSPFKSPGPDATRIKPFMNSIIFDTQSAFIPGRLITDNILVTYELNHFLKAKTGGQKEFAEIKIDMSKAYDRVEWPFLESMLCRLGFQSRLVVSNILSRFEAASAKQVSIMQNDKKERCD
ncbi:UNVERIFIED_CONTAM: hypothetical protein Sradi_2491600 [Sesamum radiatum]|uniref:Reverse transcriptase n=1 Tax=Sesamum radiatum TaxID=300843 RepID=A0AAW2SLT4_SESRA